MTAEEMVLQYWGYEADQDPNNLSVTLQKTLKNTVELMFAWQDHKMKRVRADLAAYEIVNTNQERQLDELRNDHLHLSKHNKDLIADLNAQRNQLKFKDEQLKDLKEKLGEAIRKNGLLEKQIEDIQNNIRMINNL